MIIGDKYGVAPLPPRIDADEFEIMQKMAEEERLPNFYLMEEWYLKDENAIPLVYVLQVMLTKSVYNEYPKGQERVIKITSVIYPTK